MNDAERIILNDGGILVSTTRFVSGAHTFALASISSVHGVEISPSRWSPVFLILLSLFSSGIGISTFIHPDVPLPGIIIGTIGIACIIAGVVVLLRQKPTFAIILTTAGGEVTAFCSSSEQFTGEVLDALNNAIVARG